MRRSDQRTETAAEPTRRISRGENDILEILWEHGAQTLSQMHRRLADANGRPVIQAVQTRLMRMVERNLLERRGGPPAIFMAVVTREEAGSHLLQTFREMTGEHAATTLIHLLSRQRLTKAEIGEIRAILDRHEAADAPKSSPKTSDPEVADAVEPASSASRRRNVS